MDIEMAGKKNTDAMDSAQFQQGEMRSTLVSDAVFGEMNEDGPNYRNVLHPIANISFKIESLSSNY